MTLQFSRSRLLWERLRQSLASGVSSNVRAEVSDTCVQPMNRGISSSP